MGDSRFKVVFEKLAEVADAQEAPLPDETWLVREEFDEIAELRRLALEISEPEPRSYTVS